MVGSEENYNFDVGVKGLREELIPFAHFFNSLLHKLSYVKLCGFLYTNRS